MEVVTQVSLVDDEDPTMALTRAQGRSCPWVTSDGVADELGF